MRNRLPYSSDATEGLELLPSATGICCSGGVPAAAPVAMVRVSQVTPPSVLYDTLREPAPSVFEAANMPCDSVSEKLAAAVVVRFVVPALADPMLTATRIRALAGAL